MDIFYKTITVFCKYPFQTEVDYKYVEFYKKTKRKGSKRYVKIENLVFDSDTTTNEKIEFLKEALDQKEITLTKLN